MQIVIDIPEEDYIRLRDEGMFGNVTTFKRAVKEGVPISEPAPCEDVSDINDENIYECPCGYGWDKNKVVRHHFCPNCGRAVNSTELEPCADAISKQAVLDMLEDINAETEGVGFYYKHYVEYIKNLPPVTPQYTDTEIQKMQDLESVEIQTAYEIGKAEGSEVLDKIRAKLHATAEMHEDGYYYLREEWIDEIFDKYKAGSEE